ncbi:LacI family DNA-binding transcriptional regulator [Bifidobacterium oedipodis]|uniref:LacI family transcriptional regulator n=1 Tax=Bifidobacterium oedipodis TaxID=2675322 RepID=A0A7Y0EPQ4_9BIFI|nr:LacI family DNA-binding transcriptional regulator [Bifidobacterium sp. DSM 109957]NMM94135.1 LacI family transcriptional regulator [Bifidobacterium sp. DSM 109957]
MARRSSRITMADVAHAAGVSVASVSNYLNNRPYMTDDMRERIASAIERLGYQVNSSARNLRSGRTHLIKLSIPDLKQVYFSELAEDVLAEARLRGYGVIVESTTNNRERELDSVNSMGSHTTDGLILSPLMMRQADVHLLDNDIPLVVLGERLFDVSAPHVVIANARGAAMMTQHLLDAGCRRIAVVGGVRGTRSEQSSGVIRTQGYRDALAQAGVAYDPQLIVETDGWGSRDGADAVRRMLADQLEFDAVFALNDCLAWGVLRQLRACGVDVPAKVRVVGFDNVEESEFMIPSLTTVDPSKREIARLAVESVIQQIESGTRAGASMIEAPIELVYRESSPC